MELYNIERLVLEYLKVTGMKEDDIIMFIGNDPVTARELMGEHPKSNVYKHLLSSIAKNIHF